MEMEEQYGITDLTHYMSGAGRPVFTAVPPPNHLLSAVGGHHHHHAAQHHHYDQMVMAAAAAAASAGAGGGMLYRGGGGGGGGSDHSTNNTAANSTTAVGGCGLEMEIGGGGCGGDGGNGRWPRQETLTLLEVRSRLDSKFKEANQKGPLWDEVSRIMSEEHGYQRSGKKCREKFENLYKYYKKTKEGKAGRQDGKHYRFFRQLEALYGETSGGNTISASFPDTGTAHSNLVMGTSSFQVPPQPSNYRSHDHIPFQPPPRLCCDSLSLSTSSPFDSSSSDSMENQMRTKRGDYKRSWKVKIKEFIDSQMTRLMEKQEEWLQKMMKTIEHKEQERVLREEEWRREEAARIDREHKFWANERAWMEARDAAFMEALHRLTESKGGNASPDHDPWEETEVMRLMHLRRGMEASFRQGGCPEEVLWEEVSAKMACLGYDRNGSACKAKWDSVNSHLAKTKKQKETSRSSNHLYANNINYDPRLVANCEEEDDRRHHRGGSPPLTTTSTPPCHVNENGYRFLIGEPENMWESYGMKLTLTKEEGANNL